MSILHLGDLLLNTLGREACLRGKAFVVAGINLRVHLFDRSALRRGRGGLSRQGVAFRPLSYVGEVDFLSPLEQVNIEVYSYLVKHHMYIYIYCLCFM